MSRGPLGTARPLSLAAIDAAISETIGKPVRADRLARDDGIYRWVVRRAIAEGSRRFNCTYAEAAAGTGYDLPRLNCRANRREARHRRVSTVYRALSSLAAAGLLCFHGVKRANGQWRCLSVELLPAGFGPLAPFGRSPRAPRRCPGRRIRFSRRSGTSPTVDRRSNGSELRKRRPRTRGAPPGEQRRGDEAALLDAIATEKPTDAPPAARPWPQDFFDHRVDERLVRLVDLFEEEFGIPAKFNYSRWGEKVLEELRLLDRYAGDHFEAGRKLGAGYRLAAALIRRQAYYQRTGNRYATARAQPASLVFFYFKLRWERRKRRPVHKRQIRQERVERHPKARAAI